MDSQGYGLLVEEQDDDICAKNRNEKEEANTSQHNEFKSNVNDCDIVTGTETSMPYLSDNGEANFRDEDLQVNSKRNEPPLIETRYL